MKIAIHKNERKGYFSNRWLVYCQNNDIQYKIVDCYSNTIIDDLSDCSALMWHFTHGDARDVLFAKQLIKSLEIINFPVFPNYNSCWHFDDKVGQKYLLESIKAPMAASHVFYDRKSALEWSKTIDFPTVFKLRGGAGSSNVKLAKTPKECAKLIKRAFGKGFRQFDRLALLKDSFFRLKNKKETYLNFFKELGKVFVESQYEKVVGKERGYVYFQEFSPNNTFDIRVIVIGGKAFALKRYVRENDFRASGSGLIEYEKEGINENCVKVAFDISKKIKSNCLAFDFIFDKENNPLIVEVSFGFATDAYDKCPGYWDENLNWFEGVFCPQNWMVQDLISEFKKIKS